MQRGFPSPPTYHIKRLREAPPSYFYDVITNGYGAMYSFAARVQPETAGRSPLISAPCSSARTRAPPISILGWRAQP